MRPAAFLFDLDGTLVDTESVWARSMVDYIVKSGGRATVSEILEMVVGRNWLDIHKMLHEKYPSLGDTSPMQDAIVLRRYYDRRASEPQTMRIESSIAFFRKAAQIAPCAVVSGSPGADVATAIAMCGLTDVAEFILGAGDYERGKPDPCGYLKAAAMLGVLPGDCVVVEDSTVGVQAGVAAGMKVLALDRSKDLHQDYSGAAWVVKSLADIDFGKEFAQ